MNKSGPAASNDAGGKSVYGRQQLVSIIKTLHGESDRGCILVAASWLEDCLDKLLRAKFKQASKINKAAMDSLLSYEEKSPPLASATARVKVCEALGLIDRKTTKALRALFNYRNAAGHWRDDLSLAAPSDAPALKELGRLIANAPGLPELTLGKQKTDWAGRVPFILAALGIVVELTGTIKLIENHPNPPNPLLLPPK